MFYEDFESIECLKTLFEITDDDLQGVEILFAIYRTDKCLVLFKKDDNLFIVEDFHCCCYGLEGQWDPVPTNENALKMQVDAKSNYYRFEPFIEFCREYFQWK